MSGQERLYYYIGIRAKSKSFNWSCGRMYRLMKEEENLIKPTTKRGQCNQSYLQWISNRKRFSEWLDDTTIHGTVHVFKSKSLFRRLLWTVIFVSAVGICLYTIVDQIYKFANFPSSTTITLAMSQEGLEFPAVTLCNINLVQRTAAETNHIADLIHVYQTPHNCSLSNCSNEPLRNVLFNVRQPLDEFVRRCVFIGHVGERETIISCSFVPTLTDYGYCYTFNGDESSAKLYVRNTGSRYGLHLVLNINQSENLPISLESGVRVAIHPRGEPPEPEDKGIAVAPQRSAYIGLRKTRVEDTSTSGNCDHPCLNFFQKYSLAACRLNHYYRMVAKNCECIAQVNDTQMVHNLCNVNDYIPNLSSLRNCTVCDSCCMIQQAFISSSSDVCRSPCVFTAFEFTTSYSAHLLDADAMELAEQSNVNIAQVQNDLLSISVFFEEIYEKTISTKDSFTFSTLLARIGGNLGLFLGASIISMLELGWFLSEDAYEYLFKKPSKNSVMQTE